MTTYERDESGRWIDPDTGKTYGSVQGLLAAKRSRERRIEQDDATADTIPPPTVRSTGAVTMAHLSAPLDPSIADAIGVRGSTVTLRPGDGDVASLERDGTVVVIRTHGRRTFVAPFDMLEEQ